MKQCGKTTAKAGCIFVSAQSVFLCRLLPKPTEGDLLSEDKVICNLSVSGHLLDSRRRVRLIRLDRKQHDSTYLHISDRSDQELGKTKQKYDAKAVDCAFFVNVFDMVNSFLHGLFLYIYIYIF